MINNITQYFLGVQHIGIPTNDMDATERFYTGLGFEKILDTVNAGDRVCFFKAGGVVFETYEAAAVAGCYGAIDHVSIDVSDVEAVYKNVTAEGFKVVTQGIEQLPFFNGVRFFTIEGPNKEKVEFNQYL